MSDMKKYQLFSGENIPPSTTHLQLSPTTVTISATRPQGQLQAEQQKSVELSVSLGEAGPKSNRNGKCWMGKMMVNRWMSGQLPGFETKPMANSAFLVEHSASQ